MTEPSIRSDITDVGLMVLGFMKFVNIVFILGLVPRSKKICPLFISYPIRNKLGRHFLCPVLYTLPISMSIRFYEKCRKSFPTSIIVSARPDLNRRTAVLQTEAIDHSATRTYSSRWRDRTSAPWFRAMYPAIRLIGQSGSGRCRSCSSRAGARCFY